MGGNKGNSLNAQRTTRVRDLTQFSRLPKFGKFSLRWRRRHFSSLVSEIVCLLVGSRTLARLRFVRDLKSKFAFENCTCAIKINRRHINKRKFSVFLFLLFFWLAQTVQRASFHACLNLKLSLYSIFFYSVAAMKVFYASRFGLTICSVFLSVMYGFFYFSIQNLQKILFPKLNLHIRVSALLAAVSLWREARKIVSSHDRAGSVTSLGPNP